MLAHHTYSSTQRLPRESATATAAFDLGTADDNNERPGRMAFLAAPMLTAEELPDDAAVHYALEQCDQADFATGVYTIANDAIVQRGAAGDGAAAAELTITLPEECRRYVRAVARRDGELKTRKSLTLTVARR